MDNDYYNYANSIIISRKGKLKESLSILNNLITKYPENFFLMETKADLLISHGYTNEGKKFYQKVFKKDNKNNYVKKRIFEIEYEKINETDNNINLEFFDNFSDLLLVFHDDILLQKKFKKVSKYLKKNEWVNFIDSNILIIDEKNEKALEKLNDILNNSKDNELIYITKKMIKLISNE